jgi:hypothetical protein
LDFSAFDHKQLDDYAAQAKSLWGKTEAYKEYEQKSAGKTRDQQQAEGDQSAGAEQGVGDHRYGGDDGGGATVLQHLDYGADIGAQTGEQNDDGQYQQDDAADTGAVVVLLIHNLSSFLTY